MIRSIEEVGFGEVLRLARDLTLAELPDKREPIDIYLDLARLCVVQRIGDSLDRVPATIAHKQGLVESEAYAIAQPAHLHDAGYTPHNLIALMYEVASNQPASG